MKILTSTTLSLFTAVCAISPAVANPIPAVESLAQVAPGTEEAGPMEVRPAEAFTQPITGQIVEVDAEAGRVTLQTTQGKTLLLRVDPVTITDLELLPGRSIAVNYNNLMIGVIQAATNTSVDIELPNGDRITYLYPDIARQTLGIGSRVVVTPDRVIGPLREFQLDAFNITPLQPVAIAPPAVTPAPTPEPEAVPAPAAPAPQAAPAAPAPAPQAVPAPAAPAPVEGLW